MSKRKIFEAFGRQELLLLREKFAVSVTQGRSKGDLVAALVRSRRVVLQEGLAALPVAALKAACKKLGGHCKSNNKAGYVAALTSLLGTGKPSPERSATRSARPAKERPAPAPSKASTAPKRGTKKAPSPPERTTKKLPRADKRKNGATWTDAVDSATDLRRNDLRAARAAALAHRDNVGKLSKNLRQPPAPGSLQRSVLERPRTAVGHLSDHETNAAIARQTDHKSDKRTLAARMQRRLPLHP